MSSSSRLGYGRIYIRKSISSQQGTGKTYRDGQVVNTSKLSDLADVSERSAHDDGLVAELLVVVENGLDGRNTGVLLLGVLLLVRSLEPVENTADERADQEGAGLGGGDGLRQGEHEGQVAVDGVVALQDLGGLDALPGGGDLDKNTLLLDANGLVQGDQLLGLSGMRGYPNNNEIVHIPWPW